MQAYETFPGRILIAYHPYPTQPVAETIAVALEAAGEQGKFREMHDYLIGDESVDSARMISSARSAVADINDFALAYLQEAAQNIGLDMESFNKALSDESLYEKVREAKQEAVERGVTTTSLFINGEAYVNSHGTLEEFYAALDEAPQPQVNNAED